MNKDFWKNRRVLVTGHTGFKGSWLCLWLQAMGADVKGYALKPVTEPNIFDVARVSHGMESRIADVRDLDSLKAFIESTRPEVIFHLAAQALVRRSYKNPVETYATNVMGTVNLFEAVRLTKTARVVVNITSDKCYDNREWHWGYREHEPMGGKDPYSSSKGCAELVTSAYRHSFFSGKTEGERVSVASTRAGNVIGGGDWAEDRLIPDIIRAVMKREQVVIRNPDAVRPWQHVLEPLAGYMLLAERLWLDDSFEGGWNYGPNDDDVRPVSWIATTLTGMWGNGAGWVIDGQAHPHEATYLKLDSSKARNLLKWQPRLCLHDALGWIIDWYKALNDNKDMRAFTESQISRYSERLSIGRP